MVKEHASKDIPLSLLKMFQEYFICIGLWLGRIFISKFIYLFFEFRISLKVERKLSFIMLLHINSVSDFSQFLQIVLCRSFNLYILICYPDAGYGASGNSCFKLLCRSICNLLICPLRMFADEFLDGFADAVNIFPGSLRSTIILKYGLNTEKPFGAQQLANRIAMKPTDFAGNPVFTITKLDKLHDSKSSFVYLSGIKTNDRTILKINGNSGFSVH